MGDLGPSTWPDDGGLEILSAGIALDNQFIDGGQALVRGTLQAAAGPFRMESLSHRTLLQFRSIGGDQPMAMRPFSATLPFQMTRESDMWLFKEAAGDERSHLLFLDRPMVDQWHIPSFYTGQTISKSSRLSAWGLAGVDSTTRPVTVLVDGVEQTLVGTAPGTGQARVSDPGLGNPFQVETPSSLSGTLLTLRYVPQMRVALTAFAETSSDFNDYRFSVSVREVLQTDYQGVAA